MSYVVLYERVTEVSCAVGPFDDKYVAAKYAEANHGTTFEVWRVVELTAPVVAKAVEAAKP